MKNHTILCVDDDENLVNVLKVILRKSNYDVFTASDGFEALDILKSKPIDVAIVDYKMPKMDGVELLKKIKEFNNEIDVLMLTGYGTIPNAVECIQFGAYDYIVKPFRKAEIISSVRKITSGKTKAPVVSAEKPKKYIFNNLVGRSPGMLEIYDTISRISDSESNVLILGETGTGKGEIAKAIHYSGDGVHKNFNLIDCASINPNLFESELFGHMKGAFTGADRDKIGLLKLTGDGTIFLDEIADIPKHVQVKLLRAIQEKEFRAVGGIQQQNFRARILAATNKDLQKAMENEEFRQDLFYRLSVVTIEIPPLRERIDDIRLLADHFIKKYDKNRNQISALSEAALEVMENYNWPGNVRELENCIERAFSLGVRETIDKDDLPHSIKIIDTDNNLKIENENGTMSDFEKQIITQAINSANGNKRQAARELNIGIATLYRKMKKYDLN